MRDLNIWVARGAGQGAALRAARCLAAVWGPGSRLVRGAALPGRPGYDLSIQPASLLRDTVTLQHHAPTLCAGLRRATAIGSSSAAWDGLDAWEPWRSLHAPLPSHLGLGRIDLGRPWMLVDGGDRAACALFDEAPCLPFQVHAHGCLARPHPRVEVTWANAGHAIGPLLGRTSIVVGSGGPLIYDAWRAQIEVMPSLQPGTRPLLPPTEDPLLAHQVPPSLLEEEELWKQVKRQLLLLREGAKAVSPTLLPALIEAGRHRRLARLDSRSPLERVARKVRKLRREPGAFFRDALPARWSKKTWP